VDIEITYTFTGSADPGSTSMIIFLTGALAIPAGTTSYLVNIPVLD